MISIICISLKISVYAYNLEVLVHFQNQKKVGTYILQLPCWPV